VQCTRAQRCGGPKICPTLFFKVFLGGRGGPFGILARGPTATLLRHWSPPRKLHDYAQIPRDRFPRSILARMSATSRACRACRATSSSSLPLAYLIGRPAVCCGVVLPVCPCVGVVHRSPRARHARLVGDILARMSRGCYENATRKTASVEFKLYAATGELMNSYHD